MRPTTLTLSGFRSHEQETTIDFTGRRLLAIVGPVGSGKSSILDGISYALYGKTPREKSHLSNLICSSSTEAHVRLEFSIDGDAYRVTRALTRKGKSEHILEALDSGEKHIGAREISEKIEELLGLDFGAFCSSVLLAQGRFSEFLEAAPTKQAQILKGAFRLEQIDELRDAAKRRVGELGIEIAKITGARAEISEDIQERHKQAKTDAKLSADRSERLRKAVPAEKELLKTIDQIAQEIADAESKLRRVTATMAKVPAPEDLEALVEEENKVAARIAEATTTLDACSKEQKVAGETFTKLEKKLGSEESLIEARTNARSLLEMAKEITGLQSVVEEKKRVLAEAEQELKEASGEEVAAANALDEARAARSKVEHAHKAHALRADLKKGEPCPVCEKVVSSIPRKAAPGPLKSVATKEKASDEALKEAQSHRSEAEKFVERMATQLSAATDGVKIAHARFKELDESVQEVAGRASDPNAEIVGRLGELKTAGGRAQVAVEARERAREALDSSTATQSEFGLRRQKAAAALIEVAGRIDLDAPEVDADSESLAGYATTVRTALEESKANARSSLDKSDLRRREATDEIGTLRAKLELGEDEPVQEALSDAKAREAVAAQLVKKLGADIERDKELAAKLGVLAARSGLFGQLADDFTDRHFISFLLEDRRRLLSELGSMRLREMTGRYRFDDEVKFNIVDEFDGEKVRDHTTLSGGETFLASLALALGLAEAVARHGGRLQCFFLDEGFASLDAESLELAMDGIEEIVGEDKLIGLVSHLPGVAQRVDDRIELVKGPDGMSIVKSGASL